MTDINDILEQIIEIPELTEGALLTKEEKRKKTWRQSSKKYYQQHKEKIIKRVLTNYHNKMTDDIF